MGRAAFRSFLLGLSGILLPACGGGGGGGGGAVPAGSLASLLVSSGTLSPSFDPQVWNYTIGPGLVDSTITVTPTGAGPGFTITVNGNPVASGVPSAPITINAGINTVTIVVTEAGGGSQTYVVTVIRAGVQTQGAYLKTSNPDPFDFWGHSVAISGDTIVVGSRNEASSATGVNGNQADNSATDAGAVYVFVRTGGVWFQQAYLKASNAETDDEFGVSVAVSGDTIVVGAHDEAGGATGVNGNEADNGTSGAGAAYVFVRSGSVWSQEAYLKASNPGVNDAFGGSVAISGDTIVVGAIWEDSNATGVNGDGTDNSASASGAAYVFTRSGTVWSQQAYLKASNTGGNDRFGRSVAVLGDTLIVGADNEASAATGINGNQADDSAFGAGAAYVFTRSGVVWSQQAYLKASNAEGTDFFGGSIAFSGDTLVVGAIGEASAATGVNGNEADNSAGDAGAAYVFTRTGSVWSQEAYLKASNTDPVDRFGFRVGVDGDTAVVATYFEESNAAGINGNQLDNSWTFAGAAYVFTRAGTTWSQDSYLKPSNADDGDTFGTGVGISGGTIVVGAVGEDSGATGVDGNEADNSVLSSGAAYVFE